MINRQIIFGRRESPRSGFKLQFIFGSATAKRFGGEEKKKKKKKNLSVRDLNF